MDAADVVIFQRYFPMEATWPIVDRALCSGRPVLYDWTTASGPSPGPPMAARLASVAPFCRDLAARADALTVSTPELGRVFADVARRVEVLPNLVDERLFSVARRRSRPPGSPVRVVLRGNPTHTGDLDMILPALAAVKNRFGAGVELFFFGCSPAAVMPFSLGTVLDFTDDYGEYVRRLVTLAPDIGLAPLRDTPFNRAKSDIKALEYAALGAAGVLSDLAPTGRGGRAPGDSGRTDPRDWEEAVSRLVADEPFRRKIAGRARAEAVSRRGLAGHARMYGDFWEAMAHGR
jgi:glycosyltransferase involved in cell wall biosynthesis